MTLIKTKKQKNKKKKQKQKTKKPKTKTKKRKNQAKIVFLHVYHAFYQVEILNKYTSKGMKCYWTYEQQAMVQACSKESELTFKQDKTWIDG